jgi:hypothetical protein
MGKDGKPTQESLDNLYNFLSEKVGHGSSISADYDTTVDFDKVVGFALRRMNDPLRDRYSIFSNNCRTFARDAMEAGRL